MQAGRHFAVLTYWKYAPRAKMAAALLDDFFEHARRVLALGFSQANPGLFPEIFYRFINLAFRFLVFWVREDRWI